MGDLPDRDLGLVWCAISAARVWISCASRAIFGADRSRSSMVCTTRPGTTLGALGVTAIWPTVPTCRPASRRTISFTAIVRYEEASSASRRSGMGVVPA